MQLLLIFFSLSLTLLETCINSMASLWSRNTKVENESNETMVVKVIRDPGNFEFKEFIIPAGDHIYMCYNDFGIEHNPDRPVNVRVYVGDEQKLYIRASTIRDSGKIVLGYENGMVTPTFIDMYMVARIGYFSRLQPLNLIIVCFFFFFLIKVHCLLALLWFHRLIIKMKGATKKIKKLLGK